MHGLPKPAVKLVLADRRSQDRPGPASWLEPLRGRPGPPGRPSDLPPSINSIPSLRKWRGNSVRSPSGWLQEDDSIRQLESRLQSLELEHDVPTEEVLLAARQRRDHGWRLVKAAWLDRASGTEDHAAFLVEFAPTGTLASAYEQSVERSDALADRLRREADRVAHKAESLAQLHRHRTTRATLDR